MSSSSRKGKCPSGYISRVAYDRKGHVRKAYSRKSRKGSKKTSVKGSYVSRAHVSRGCTPDKGAPGKTPKSRRVLPKLGKEIELGRYGYKVHSAEAARHKALRDASEAHGALKILRRLNLIANYTAEADNEQVLRDDVKYVSGLYDKEKRMAGRSVSRKSRKSRTSRKSRKSQH